MKCNTDGASRGNPGESSYGFCIRDSQCDLVYVEIMAIGIATNMEVECIAILKDLRHYKREDIQTIIIESDPQSLVKIVLKEWRIPWSLVVHIDEIHKLMDMMQVKIIHAFREANQLEDKLANKVLKIQEKL